MKRREEDRKREYWLALFLSISGAVLMAILLTISIFETWNTQGREQYGEQAAETPEDLIIENPDPCNTGSIVVYANGGVYAFYGSFDIENDGRDGNEISMMLEGYMEAGYPHGEPEAPEFYGP